jgi:hypothetical protein
MTIGNAYYVIKYETDGGESLEVWNAGRDILILEGMHAILTYSICPERVISFRQVGPQFRH